MRKKISLYYIVFIKLFIILSLIFFSNKPVNNSRKIILSKKSDNKNVNYFNPAGINIFSMNYDGTNLEQLTFSEDAYVHGVYSPDGKWIAFLSKNKLKTFITWDIYIMDQNGNNIKKLIELDSSAGELNWSPNSKKIVFTSDSNIFKIDTDGSNLTQLTSTNGFNELPVWSPDGRYISFVSDREGGSFLYLMNKNGSDQEKLLDEDVSCYDKASWSPDSNKIVCQYDRGIAIVDIKNRDIKKITSEKNLSKLYCGNPVWSPDEKWIAFDARDFDKDITDIYLCNVQTFKILRVSEDKWFIEPKWSADSKILFFFSTRYENDIYSYDIKTKKTVKITNGNIVDRHISVK